ncbi:MAG: FkbM family methyltransferase [Oceanicaulis sp.]
MTNSSGAPDIGPVIASINAGGVPTKTVLDVGIREKTPFLMQNFPHHRHYLFEPMREWHDAIKAAYAGLDYELIPSACGSEDGRVEFRTAFMQAGFDKPSHGGMTGFIPESEVADRYEVEVVRLDSFIETRGLEGPFCLKVDVDGADLEVLKGAERTLESCNIVSLEMTRRNFAAIAGFMHDRGFYLHSLTGLEFGATPMDAEADRPATALRFGDGVFLPMKWFGSPDLKPSLVPGR